MYSYFQRQYFTTLKVILTLVVAFILSISTSTASISSTIEAEKTTLLNVLGLKKVPNILPSEREKIQIPEHIKEHGHQKPRASSPETPKSSPNGAKRGPGGPPNRKIT